MRVSHEISRSSPPERSIARRLFDLALPVIGLNVLTVLSLAVDTAMCGRLPNAEIALTALGFATQVVFLLMVGMMGLAVGTVALVARAHGAGEKERVNHVLLQSTQLTVLVGLGIGGIGLLFADEILAVLGADATVRGEGVAYLQPLLLFTTFYYLNLLYAAILRGVGNTRLPFVIALVANAINVLVNYALILGNWGCPALGVRGAAIGTVVCHAFSSIALIVMIRRGAVPGLFLPLRPRRIDRTLASELFRVGAPAALDMVILNAGFLSIIGMLGRLAPVAVAAHGVGIRVQSLAFVPGLSVSQATGAMVGNALGAHNVDEARSVVRAAVRLCVGIMGTIAIVLLVGAEPILRLFDVPEGTALWRYALEWMRLLGWSMPVVGINIAFIGMLRGAGATNTSLLINLVGTVVFQVPGSYLLGFPAGLGPFGVWLAFPLSFGIKALLGFIAFHRGHWARVGSTLAPDVNASAPDLSR